MKKIAIISDIHANLPALKAVLADIEDEFRADHIYCLGDLTDGAPWHNEVINLIRKLEIPTLMGNHDERIAFDHPVFALKKHSLEEQEARLSAINWTKESITEENKTFLAQLPKVYHIEYEGLSCHLVHGSPSSNEEYVYEDHNEDLLVEMFDKSNSDVIIAGHTHLSYIRHIEDSKNGRNKLYINAGSVGRSKEKNGGKAVYLWLTIDDGQIHPVLRKIDYDIQEAISGIRDSCVPDFYAGFLQKSLDSTK